MKQKRVKLPVELKERLEQLYDDYAGVVDRQDLMAWPEFFADDCKYVVTARENFDAGLPHGAIYCEGIGMVRDRAAATRDCTVYEPRYLKHFIDRLRILDFSENVISCEAAFLVIESVSDQPPQILVVGTYVDKIVVGDNDLRIRERYCVYDNYRIRNSLVFPV